MTPIFLKLIIGILYITLTFFPANAETVYKHVDKNGKVTYSSIPVDYQNTEALKFRASQGEANNYGNKEYAIKIKSIKTIFLSKDYVGDIWFSVNVFYKNETNQDISITLQVKAMDGLGNLIKDYYLGSSAKAKGYATASSSRTWLTGHQYRSIKEWKVIYTRIKYDFANGEYEGAKYMIQETLKDVKKSVAKFEINTRIEKEIKKDVYAKRRSKEASLVKKIKAQHKIVEYTPREIIRSPNILFKAIREGDVETVKEELGKGINANVREHGRTALMIASSRGNVQVIKTILLKGGSTEAENDLGWTPLFYAAKNDHAEAVKELLTYTKDIDHRDKKGNTILMHLAHSGSLSVVKVLVEAGADLNMRDLRRRQAATIAYNENPRVGNYLYEAMNK